MVKTVVGKSGWSDEETQMLMGEARSASEKGMPLKRAFDVIAELTGRKPNSIRNYYYLRVKDDEEHRSNVFVPFSHEQVRALMRRMLCERAAGKSVRSIAFDMAQGDKKDMLRYQNKYRSVLKNDEELVLEIMQELSQSGIPFVNPYEHCQKHRDISCVIAELAENLSKLDVDAEALLTNLCDISRSASAHVSATAYPTDEQLQRLNALTRLNRDFVAMTGMERISHLNEYVLSLQGEL